MKLKLLYVLVYFISLCGGQTLIVNTELDTVDANDGLFSIREAVDSANTSAGKQIIRFNETVFSPGSNRIIYLKSSLGLSDNSGVDISGVDTRVTLDGSQAKIFKDAIVLQSGSNEISNINFQNFGGSAVVIDALSPGDNQIGPDNLIGECRGAGVKIIGSENNTVTGNNIWNCGMDSLILDDISVDNQDGIMLLMNADNNTISENNCWSNYNSGIAGYRSSNNTFSNNYMAANHMYGLAIHEGSGGNMISDNDFLENIFAQIYLFGPENNSNEISGNNIGDESNLSQKTLSNLRSSGSTGQVKHMHSPFPAKINTVTEIPFPHLTNNPNVVKGESLYKPHIIALAASNGIQLMGTSDIDIHDNQISNQTSAGIMLQGIQYIDSSGVQPDTIYAFPSAISIAENRFENLLGYGVIFVETHDISFMDNNFNNVLSAIYGTGISNFNPEDAGLDSTDRGTFTIMNNSFSGTASSQFAIFISIFNKTTIENNVIEDYSFGLFITAGNQNSITSNTFKSIRNFGIYAVQVKNSSIRENQMEDIKQFGVYLVGIGKSAGNESTEIVHNRLSSVGNNGILIAGMTVINVTANQIDNVYQGYDLSLAGIGTAVLDSNMLGQSLNSGLLATDLDTLRMINNEIKNQVQFQNVQLSSIKQAFLSKNKLLNGSTGGLLADKVDSLQLKQNEFRNSGMMGAAISAGAFTMLRDNNFSGNNQYGLSINTVGKVELMENNFISNASGAMLSSINDLLIRHNNIYKNTQTGVLMESDTTAVCDSNYFAQNNKGLEIISVDSLTMPFNSFIDNKLYGVENNMIDTIDARMNYWGHVEGPTVGDSLYPGSRKGDKILGYIKYEPYLTEAAFNSSIKPQITSIDPNESDQPGGANAELSGDNFMPGIQVFFGNDTVHQVTYLSLQHLQIVIPPGDGGYYDVIVKNPNGLSDTLANGIYYIPEEPLTVNETGLPLKYALHQNYPNPFNPVTTIRYDIVNSTHVEISVYDIAGRKVATLVDKNQMPGNYAVEWDAKNMASGIYFYTIHSKPFTKTRKLILLK